MQNFALGNRCRGGGQDAQHLKRPIRHHQLKGAGEEEITNQHGSLIAEKRIGAGLAAPERAFIHHIIMKQRRRMDEFHTGRE